MCIAQKYELQLTISCVKNRFTICLSKYDSMIMFKEFYDIFSK